MKSVGVPLLIDGAGPGAVKSSQIQARKCHFQGRRPRGSGKGLEAIRGDLRVVKGPCRVKTGRRRAGGPGESETGQINGGESAGARKARKAWPWKGRE